MSPANELRRIQSIDAFRGITIFTMVFVNELAGVRDIPQWMKHMPADADAMTFVDMVFPAFLFIVGMSIPFALKNRLQKGDSFWQLQWHILWRTIGLLILGVFMVNGESGYVNEAAMGIPVHLWLLLFYTCIILVWNVYHFKKRKWTIVFRTVGITGLIILAFIYRGGKDGTELLQPRWWGILGLIGWAYLLACIFYQLFKKRMAAMIGMAGVCTLFYALAHTPATNKYMGWWAEQSGHAAHTSIVLYGVVLSLIYFGEKRTTQPFPERFAGALAFAAVLFAAGYFLRPWFTISKIYATPTWCLYSAAACCLLFSFLYWLTDVKKINGWIHFFKPAATNPLLTYIIPGILYAAFSLLHISVFPNSLRYGLPGIIWSAFFAVTVMYIAMGLNKLKIRLQL
ncbi:MAG: DUF5009 domain-containing protein [Chitinophagaceae bacterium]|nr:DUF5009 domain-containing protein [Chitinophagaceae bacterium]